VLVRSQLCKVKPYEFVQERIFDGVGVQCCEVSVLAAIERVDFNALIEGCVGNVGQLTGRTGQLVQPVSPRSVTSTIGHVGIWLEMRPTPPEELTRLVQMRRKREIMGGNQCVMSSLNTAAYIGINGDHSLFLSPERDSSIQRCERSVRSVIPCATILRQRVRLIKSLEIGEEECNSTIMTQLRQPMPETGRRNCARI